MNRKQLDGALPLVAALLLILTNLWSARTSFVVSLVLLVLLSVYYFSSGNGR